MVVQIGKSIWKTIWQYLVKLNLCISYDEVIPVVDLYQEELPCVHKDTHACTNVHERVFFVILKTGKQLNYHKQNEYINYGVFI